MKKLLIPTDFSQENQIALEWAAEFARTQETELILLHAWLPPVIPGDTTGMIEMYASLYQEHRSLADKKMSDLLALPELKSI
ncbi:MAG: universal stress protein, partial [Bacteroidia bacterium]|nr:universal stress protein [Bacteroidia bacterium]